MRKVNKKQPHFDIKNIFHKIALGMGITVIVCAVLFGFHAVYNGIVRNKIKQAEDVSNNFLKKIGFVISDNVLIYGRDRTDLDSIKKALKIPEDQLITHLNLKKIQANLKALPWVKNARVVRQLPNVLHITLFERKPIALFQQGKNYFPIDEEGELVPIDEGNVEELIIIVGSGAPMQTPVLMKKLEERPLIKERVMGAAYIDKRRWRLYIDDLNDGIIVDLPDTDLSKSLLRLEELHNKHKVLDKQLKRLDLRFEGKEYITPLTADSILRPFSSKEMTK